MAASNKNAVGPDLTKYMDKQLLIKLNANRDIKGVLRGFDQFMNLVIEETVAVKDNEQQKEIGTTVVRGNSILRMIALERID